MPRLDVAHALIDFHNAADLRQGVSMTFSDYEDAFEAVITRLLSLVSGLQPRPNHLACRLYGGWVTDTAESDDYHYVSAVARKWIPSHGRVRVVFAFARALWAFPELPLNTTLRYQSGLPPFRTIAPQAACALSAAPNACSLFAMKRWQAGRCPEKTCAVIDEQAFSRRRQKTVDTTLCCDTLFIAEEDPQSWVVVVSDDDDMVPCLISAGARSSKIVQLRPLRRRGPHHYDSQLQAGGVRIQDW